MRDCERVLLFVSVIIVCVCVCVCVCVYLCMFVYVHKWFQREKKWPVRGDIVASQAESFFLRLSKTE